MMAKPSHCHSGQSSDTAWEKPEALQQKHQLPHADAMAEALLTEKPSAWTKAMFKLYGFCVIAFLCSTMNGSLKETPHWMP